MSRPCSLRVGEEAMMVMDDDVVRVGLALVGGLIGVLMAGGVFAYLYSRHRVFTKGLRGTALVVDVQPISLIQRRSVIERPTENVVVATAAVPRGVTVGQKVPAGQYRVGQVVPVVQAPGSPHRVYLDRPDLERPAFVVYAPLLLLLAVPFIVVAALGAG